MSIVDLELVRHPKSRAGAISARTLADALGKVFGSPTGRTWVRLHQLDPRATPKAESRFAPPTGPRSQPSCILIHRPAL